MPSKEASRRGVVSSSPAWSSGKIGVDTSVSMSLSISSPTSPDSSCSKSVLSSGLGVGERSGSGDGVANSIPDIEPEGDVDLGGRIGEEGSDAGSIVPTESTPESGGASELDDIGRSDGHTVCRLLPTNSPSSGTVGAGVMGNRRGLELVRGSDTFGLTLGVRSEAL